ncbi:hypothetical protein EON81_16565, partial [bacterium]
PGDRLAIRVSSPVQAAESTEVTIDQGGSVRIPGTNQTVVLRGLTLSQSQALIQQRLGRILNNASVEVTLGQLRSIQIRILGAAYAPGTYEVPSIITLFNALYAAGGPNADGSFRNIQLRRSNGRTVTIDLYKLLRQGASSQDVPLQPGDTILIPPAGPRISVLGEVRLPAVYEIKGGERLRETIRLAGGARPTGVTQRVQVESVRPGIERRQTDVNLLAEGAENNPPLYDGDRVEVFSIRPIITNTVTIEGAVDQPRAYAITPGIRVRELVELARGTLSDAALERADLVRTNPDGSRILIPINLALALRGDPAANVPVQAGDRLTVYTIGQIRFLSPRRVVLRGAVQRPETYYRFDGLTLRDLILQGGGLLPTANPRVALIQRTNPDGTPGPFLRADLGRALQGDPAANIAIEDDDVVTIQSVSEQAPIGEQFVEITGAVQRPATYPRSANLRVADLIELAGGALPTASQNRAFLQRTNPNGTQGPLLIVDLEKARAGDPANNVELAAGDKLSIFTLEQAAFRQEEIVNVSGGVQRPGTYVRSANMTLADALELAGGTLPNAAETIELSRAYTPQGTPVQRIRVADVRSGKDNPLLEPGTTITLPTRSDLQARPRVVYLTGAVKYPGPYLLTGANDRLSTLIQRAGGLTERAFPVGSEFARRPDQISTPRQLNLLPEVLETFRLVNDEEYKRFQALVDMDRLKIVFTQGATISGSGAASASALTGLPGAATTPAAGSVKPGESLDQALARALQSEAVTRARALGQREVVPTGNLNIDLEGAVRRPNSAKDIVLQDGDAINVPERPTTVAVSGAVIQASAVLFEPGKKIDYYMDHAGGLTSDADKTSIVIIRANGTLVRYKPGIRIELGDNILVPTKTQAVRLRENANTLQTITQTVTSAGLTYALIRALSR